MVERALALQGARRRAEIGDFSKHMLLPYVTKVDNVPMVIHSHAPRKRVTAAAPSGMSVQVQEEVRA